MGADYIDDIALLANTAAPAESLLHSLEQAADGIGLYVKADKIEFMCFNQRGDISILNGRSLRLVDKFTSEATSHLPKIISTVLQSSSCMDIDHPSISKTIKIRRARHEGYCWWSKGDLISNVLLWTHLHGQARIGRPARTYLQQLCADTGYSMEDLLRALDDRDEWLVRVREICACGTPWWWWWWSLLLSRDRS